MTAVKEKCGLSHGRAARRLLVPCKRQPSAVSVQLSNVSVTGMQLLARRLFWHQRLGTHQLTTCSATCEATALWPCKRRKQC